MEIEFNKSGTTWNNEITPKEIFERQFNIGHFILNHKSELTDNLLPILFGKYKVVMKFIDEGYNNSSIFVTRTLAYRKGKFSKVQFNEGVKLLEGTPTEMGGSNGHPRVCFKEGYCILEFECNGLPQTNYLSGWKSELISLELLTNPTNNI